MASADVTSELRCTICMDIYRDPVTLPCGHSFCRGCITQAWDHQEDLQEYKCPECQKRYLNRPQLVRNTRLHNICEAFHATETDQEQTGVFCNYCDFPVPATKSCLQCETSLCDHHLRKHDRSGEHTLLPPTPDLGKRKCSVHKEILKYYCTEDASYLCVTCRLDGEHRGHQMETLQEASEEKKKKLRNDLQTLMAETEEAEKRVQSLEERRRKAQEKADGETERVTALFRDLRRRLEELEKRVLSDIMRQVQYYDDIIRKREIKKAELSRKMRHIEELCNMTDPLTVLQESDTGDLCDTEDRHDKQFHDEGDLDVAGISNTLHTGLADIMSAVTGEIYIPIQPADILLDVTTASNRLHISDNRKTASMTPKQNRPGTSERFKHWPQVLSSRSFSSGRHYWEVDVGGSDNWRVGMCYPSIDRRGQSGIGYNDKSWGLCRYSGNQYSVRHDMKDIELPDGIPSDRVRIYLDYEAGQISFFALCDPIRHLHTFTATFTEPLHAVLCCETSLCDDHLRKHDRSGGHTLLPPTTDLGKKKCSIHKKVLEYYCTEDAACVCVSCYVIGGHVGHTMMSLDEASEEKKEKLRNDLQTLMAETEKAEKRVQSLEECRREAQEKAAGEAESHCPV
ncbi:E3 ubiquitin-protein ligase TRIM39-like [Hyperolius riggenbachi]|uniref:E3 ubiquitin-protein ligase TRIM39-like n=1 Tax=Hyperolius riggenbachi TaxID=752182 RepID=UPI0035A2DC84